MSRYGEMSFGVVVMLAAVGLFIIAGNVQDFMLSSNGVGAAFMPRIAATILLLLGLVTFSAAWRLEPAKTKKPTHLEEAKSKGGQFYALISIALMMGYIALLSSLGFVITSAIYIFCQILILRKQSPKRWVTFLAVAIFLPITAYLLFVNVFEVMVPAGLLG